MQYLECGLDEVGRGCLAGPVVAAAVILPKNIKNKEIKDSKKLSYQKRKELSIFIQNNAIDFAIKKVSVEEIDRINILQASLKAMHLCIDQLKVKPSFLRIDGNKFIPYPNIPHQTEIKGDARFLNIAAASIIAKVCRDELMEELHKEYPMYGWNKNKGYPTPFHKKAILEYGITPHHRKSFKLFDPQMGLDIK